MQQTKLLLKGMLAILQQDWIVQVEFLALLSF